MHFILERICAGGKPMKRKLILKYLEFMMIMPFLTFTLIIGGTSSLLSRQEVTSSTKNLSNVQSSSINQSWCTISYKDGLPYKIGSYQMFYPLNIPKNDLLINKAFIVQDNSNHKKFTVDFFFAPKAESQIKSWAESIPNEYPIAPKNCKSIFTQNIFQLKDSQTWMVTSTAELKRGGAAFRWFGTPGCSALNISLKNENSTSSAALTFPAWCSPDSPLKGASRIIYLEATVPYSAS